MHTGPRSALSPNRLPFALLEAGSSMPRGLRRQLADLAHEQGAVMRAGDDGAALRTVPVNAPPP